MGLGMSPTGGGNNGFFMPNGNAPTGLPLGGVIYVNSGRLLYKGSAGTVTVICPA